MRCKECRHGEKMKSKLAGRMTAVFCHKNKKERFMLGNDYCSYGERGRRQMSCSKWAYDPEKCDYDYCPGDCDNCSKAEE